MAAAGEKHGLLELRVALLAGLSGTVVEVGAGDGANFRHYPDAVTEVVAVDPEPYLRGHAEAAASAAAVPVRVVDGSARRVLRPGAELRFLEHVLAHRPGPMRRVQRSLDRFVWPQLFGGCHAGRDTVAAIDDAAFTITELERSQFPEGTHTPVSPHVHGRAVRE